eukprot:Skav209931  [mRNA]  locus=scaffold102:8986:9204:- [translate_table: standard]
MFFKLITHPSKENIELFASRLMDKDSNHGLGLYATSKAPDQWSCQDEVHGSQVDGVIVFLPLLFSIPDASDQ